MSKHRKRYFKELIKNYLLQGKTLTPRIAVSRWQCWRLAVYISRLRAAGYKIETKIVRSKDGFTYAEYRHKL